MNRTVLVVDDDDALRDSISESLLDGGYQTVCAANGREALECLRGMPELPCMIFLDLMMPVMNGWQFRDAQKQEPRLASIPVVIITANGAVPTKSVDADELLYKPIRLDRLLDTAEHFCPEAC